MRWALYSWGYNSVLSTVWGDTCETWMDSVPERTTLEKCRWLYIKYLGEETIREVARVLNHACRESQKTVDHGKIKRFGRSYEYAALALVARNRQSVAWELGINPNNPQENGYSDGLNDWYPIYVDTKATPVIW